MSVTEKVEETPYSYLHGLIKGTCRHCQVLKGFGFFGFRCQKLRDRVSSVFFGLLRGFLPRGFSASQFSRLEVNVNQSVQKTLYPRKKGGISEQGSLRAINPESKPNKFPFFYLSKLDTLKGDTVVWIGFAFFVFGLLSLFLTVILSLAFARYVPVSPTRDFGLVLSFVLFIIGIVLICIGIIIDSYS